VGRITKSHKVIGGQMSRYQPHRFEIPEETIRVAQEAFPKGNVYMTMRDTLGPLFSDADFAPLFDWRGREGVSPGLLSMTTIMQYMEGLTDRQAADAVRSRIDWKYALGLPLTHPGFHYSILSPFRDRLLEGGQEAMLFDKVLDQLKERELVKGKGQQRTDSTHVLAAVRHLNRLECVGETLRRVLDDLARMAPGWLLAQITPDWFDRYGVRIEAYRLPKEQAEREALQVQIGQDGFHLLGAIYGAQAPGWLREIPAVEVMRCVWLQQYYVQDGQIKSRDKKDLPPHKQLIVSPDDPEARNRTKRETNWTGYAVHLTETCEAEGPNIITHVETTPATTADVEVTGTIHEALADKDLLPGEHLVDTAYTSADQLLDSRSSYDIDLIGPVAGGGSWQAKADTGFDIRCFAVDWETQTITCPQGKTSQTWHLRHEKYGHPYFEVRFRPADCCTCAYRSDCTRSKRGVRVISLRPQAEYEALQAARARQETDEFKAKYKKRAGVEGTISQGTRSFDLRRSRYIGLAKTRLQHLVTATAMNLTRVAVWFMDGKPKAQTRRSPFALLAPVT
jgi:transposase